MVVLFSRVTPKMNGASKMLPLKKERLLGRVLASNLVLETSNILRRPNIDFKNSLLCLLQPKARDQTNQCIATISCHNNKFTCGMFLL